MAEPTTVAPLEVALGEVHVLASGALARIRGMALCALRALETPGGVVDLESLAEVLQAIAADSCEARHEVDATAEAAGIKTVADAWIRRLDAIVAARDQQAQYRP